MARSVLVHDSGVRPVSGSRPGLAHSAVQRQFATYLQDDLADDQRARIAEHLAACPRCGTALVAYLQSRRVTEQFLGSPPTRPHRAQPRRRLGASQAAQGEPWGSA